MAIERSSLEFHIKTTADVSGAKEVRQELKSLTAEQKSMAKTLGVKEVSDDFAKLNPHLVETSNATKTASTATAGFSEEVKKITSEISKQDTETARLVTTKQALRDAAKGLAFEFPILGKAIGMLSNPIAAVIAGVGVLAAAFHKAFADAQRAVDSVDFSKLENDLAAQQRD